MLDSIVLNKLQKAFPYDDKVHVSDVAQWLGMAWFDAAKKCADIEGFVRIR